jgi:hypothetical protein
MRNVPLFGVTVAAFAALVSCGGGSGTAKQATPTTPSTTSAGTAGSGSTGNGTMPAALKDFPVPTGWKIDNYEPGTATLYVDDGRKFPAIATAYEQALKDKGFEVGEVTAVGTDASFSAQKASAQALVTVSAAASTPAPNDVAVHIAP